LQVEPRAAAHRQGRASRGQGIGQEDEGEAGEHWDSDVRASCWWSSGWRRWPARGVLVAPRAPRTRPRKQAADVARALEESVSALKSELGQELERPPTFRSFGRRSATAPTP
jgi:hypothetical protein